MLGERVKQARYDLAMSQETLAQITGLRQFQISRIESGKTKAVMTNTLKALTQALHVSADYLIGNVDKPEAYHRN